MNPFRYLRPVRTARTRYGVLSYFVNDVWHGEAIRRYGEWSEAEAALWRKLIGPGHVAVDVGAHIGAHSLALARIVGPTGFVHCFEPQEGAHVLLRRNLARNGVSWASVWEGGLAAADGTMTYYPPDYRRPGNFGGVELGDLSGFRIRAGYRRARVYALDGLGGVRGLPVRDARIGLVKVDVEGMEAAVLSGAQETIREMRPYIYVENDRPDRSRAVVGMLHGLGYRVMWHLAPLFNPDNFRGRRKNVFGNTLSLNLLALPNGRQFPDDPHLRPLDAVEVAADGVRYRA